jgi:hypothetical protein
MTDSPIQGSLFAVDFLQETIKTLPEWSDFDDTRLDAFIESLNETFRGFPSSRSPNESVTEKDLIWPILDRLGWRHSLPQQNLTAHGREDVPDGLLFADEAAKTRANAFGKNGAVMSSGGR